MDARYARYGRRAAAYWRVRTRRSAAPQPRRQLCLAGPCAPHAAAAASRVGAACGAVVQPQTQMARTRQLARARALMNISSSSSGAVPADASAAAAAAAAASGAAMPLITVKMQRGHTVSRTGEAMRSSAPPHMEASRAATGQLPGRRRVLLWFAKFPRGDLGGGCCHIALAAAPAFPHRARRPRRRAADTRTRRQLQQATRVHVSSTAARALSALVRPAARAAWRFPQAAAVCASQPAAR